MPKIVKSPFLSYVFIVVIIATSGSTSFFSYSGSLGYFVIIPAFVLLIKRSSYISKKELAFLTFILGIIAFQHIYSGEKTSINSSILRALSVLTIFFISKVILKDFSQLYQKIMVVLSIISLFFWTGLQLSELFHSIIINFSKSLPQFSNEEDLELLRAQLFHFYVFTVPLIETFRNCGAFYEPGRFAIFLGFALALNLFKVKDTFWDKKDILFIVTLITTFSTTGIIVLIILIITRLFLIRRKPLLIVFALLISPFLIWQVMELDFMLEKVSEDYNNSESYSRFTAVIYHIGLIKERPLLGWSNNLRDFELSPNGLTQVVVQWGIIFSVFFYYFIFHGVKNIVRLNAIPNKATLVIYLVLLLLTFSQSATLDPFYFMIMCFGIYSPSKNGT